MTGVAGIQHHEEPSRIVNFLISPGATPLPTPMAPRDATGTAGELKQDDHGGHSVVPVGQSLFSRQRTLLTLGADGEVAEEDEVSVDGDSKSGTGGQSNTRAPDTPDLEVPEERTGGS